jgi:hypothetical protein
MISVHQSNEVNAVVLRGQENLGTENMSSAVNIDDGGAWEAQKQCMIYLALA